MNSATTTPISAIQNFLLRIPVLTLTLCFFALGCWAWPSMAQQLQFDRAELAAGQFWRLLTGHFTHFNTDHLFWDTAAFLALGALCERRNRKTFAACLGLSALFISVFVWLRMPEMRFYRGLSGIDSALFALLAAQLLADNLRRRDWPSAAVIGLVAAGFFFKITFEFLTASTLFAQLPETMMPVPLAHVAGAGTGILIASAARRGYSADFFAPSSAG